MNRSLRTTDSAPAAMSLLISPTAEATALAIESPPAVLRPAVLRPAVPPAVHRRRLLARRLLETLPAFLSLTIITSLLWGPILAPVPFAIGLLAFHTYWLWWTMMTGIHAVKGFRLLRRDTSIHWRALYEQHRAQGKPALDWDLICHIVIIPNYTESIEKLRLPLDSLAQSETADQIIAVLAMEEREGEAGRRKAAQLQREYQGRLGGLLVTYHPWGIPGEVAGKSANENWAARRAKELLVDQGGWDLDYLTITSCDADTVFHPKHFTCLTYKFATDPNRYRRFWQAPIFFYNNIWQVPAPIRLTHALAGVIHLSRLARGFMRLNFPMSAYSLSLRMAHEVDYWDADVIPEDWHMLLKCYYNLGGEVDVDSMYTPLYMDGVRSKSYLSTFISYFQQARRHAWGCTDVPYAIQQTIDHPEIPLIPRLRHLWAVTQSHLLWTTQWFLVTVGRVVPVLLTALGLAEVPDWFPLISGWLLTPSAATLLILIALDAILRPGRPPSFRWWLFPVQYAQWFLMPLITFFATALPALDAQVRLALGKRIEYRVTEKA